MRANVNLFWLLAGFFLLADVTYILWSLIDTGQVEWVGTVGIALSSVLGGFIAFYVGRVHKAQGAELPEDRLDADIDDGDPEWEERYHEAMAQARSRVAALRSEAG